MTAWWAFFSAILVCLVLAGCGGGGTPARTDRIEPTGPIMPPVVKEAAPQALPGEMAPPPDAAKGEAQRTPQKTTTRNEVYEEKADQAPAKPVLGERITRSRGGDLSLFLRQEDADVENLNSLLTEDYLKRFDIPIVLNDAVHYFVRYFTTEKRKIFANWLKRSRRYVPMIKEILREHGLPEDLIYVAMIESGFNPKAYSSMKACGPWQFIYETGGRYGLRVNHWVDERRDPEKSTVAAAAYLKDLFTQFGCWYLAAAAYNAGEKRIERSIEKYETGDFWELTKYNTLPRETRDYIPRLLAAAIIAKDPEKFGFTGINYDQPIRFVSEKVPAGTPLTLLARAASTDAGTIRALNPEILTGITPPDGEDYTIKLPEWTRRDTFREGLYAALDKGGKVVQVTAYTVKRRDSMGAILKRYNVAYNDLMLVNECDQTLRVRPGTVVYIPRFYHNAESIEVAQEKGQDRNEVRPVMVAQEKGQDRNEVRPVREPPAPAPAPIKPPVAKVASRPDGRAEYHVVKKGESLTGISEKYGISLAALREMNGLKRDHIHPNMRLHLASHAVNLRTASPSQARRGPEARQGGSDTPMQASVVAVRQGGEQRAKKATRYQKNVRTASYRVVKKGGNPSAMTGRRDLRSQTPKETGRNKTRKTRTGQKVRVSIASR
ncbi:MAG: transglycosylase SLT domain-containing protein [Syntrophorhabdales bacterium]|jgi:membrane-bound lytic murein transglycosylase D